jgi:membrane protease YdiL (CAAX protease family)
MNWVSASKYRVWLFLVLTCLTTAPFWVLGIVTDDSTGGRGAYAVESMWGPGIAALLTCWITGQSFAFLGWKRGQTRWQAISYLWPFTVCATAYGLVHVVGFGGFSKGDTVVALRKSLGWPNAGTWTIVSRWFLLATTGFVRGVAAALGEEIGWRGFLSPILYNRFGFTRGALLTGIIWAIWHFNLVLLKL